MKTAALTGYVETALQVLGFVLMYAVSVTILFFVIRYRFNPAGWTPLSAFLIVTLVLTTGRTIRYFLHGNHTI